MKAWHIAFVFGLFLVEASVLCAEEERWLGYFKGSLIPGYQIVELRLTTAEFSGLQSQGATKELLEYMKAQCSKQRGVALVNVTLTPAIGDVRTETSSAI